MLINVMETTSESFVFNIKMYSKRLPFTIYLPTTVHVALVHVPLIVQVITFTLALYPVSHLTSALAPYVVSEELSKT